MTGMESTYPEGPSVNQEVPLAITSLISILSLRAAWRMSVKPPLSLEWNSPKLLRLGSINYSYKYVNVVLEYLITSHPLTIIIIQIVMSLPISSTN